MPSPLSRENDFYYAHPQNRFWHVLSEVFETELLQLTNEEKREFVLQNGIALWDVLESCDIKGASDQSIRNPKANDIAPILREANIRQIFTTGQKAFTLYKKLIMPMTRIEPHPLPSSSAANFMYSLDQLVLSYRLIKKMAQED